MCIRDRLGTAVRSGIDAGRQVRRVGQRDRVQMSGQHHAFGAAQFGARDQHVADPVQPQMLQGGQGRGHGIGQGVLLSLIHI